MTRTRPGRRWTIRLVPYGRPSAGVCVIDCADPTCVSDGRRYRDPVEARTAALRHIREHVGRIELAGDASCRCRRETCAWHPSPVARCSGGQAVLALIPDVLGRVWVLAELCKACARAIPRCKIVKENEPPPPPPREAAKSDPQQAATPNAAPSAVQPRSDCLVCRAEQTANTPTPVEETPGADGAREFGPMASAAPRLVYAQHTEFVLRFCSDRAVGKSPQGRLLAVLALLRIRRDGTVRLVTEDLSAHRTGLGDDALEHLVTGGWMEARLTDVRAAVTGAPAAVCELPSLAEEWLSVGIARHARKPFNGWVQHLISNRLLAGQPAGIRLAALSVTAASDVRGNGHLGPRVLATRCAFTAPQVSAAALTKLGEIGWLEKVYPHSGGARPLSWRLSPTVRHLAPGAEPTVRPIEASISLAGRGRELAQWTHEYHRRHQHPPALHEVIAAHCVENPDAPWSDATLRTASKRVVDDGWLHIRESAEQPVQPGNSYWKYLAAQERRTADGTAARHARSPRQDVPLPPMRRDPRAAPPVGLSPNGRGPQLPLRPGAVRVAHAADSPPPDHLRGLWHIPGARDILQCEEP